MAKLTLKWLAELIANRLSWGILIFMTINFAFAPWSINPIEDALFVRSQGLLLQNNHISSALAVTLTGLWFALKNPQMVIHYTFVILSTAAIHEFALDFVDLQGMLIAHSLGYTVTPKWFIGLMFFLIPGVWLATKREKMTMIMVGLFVLIFVGSYVIVLSYYHLQLASTLVGSAPGPGFHDFWPNLFEVAGWVIPTSFWWLRR